MRKFLLSFFLFLAITNAEFIYDGLNRLDSASFDSMLSSNKYVLAFWYTRDCQKCGPVFWDVNYSIFLYGYSNSYLVAATTYSVDDELVMKYNIPEDHENVIFRLFVNGNPEPLMMDEDDSLLPWLSASMEIKSQEDVSMKVDQSNYNQFVRKSKTRNVLMFYYASYESNSQSIVVPYFKTALAFQGVSSIFFAHVDCYRNRDLCMYQHIDKVPVIRLLPLHGDTFDGRDCSITEGERIDDYVNRYMGTFISSDGGLNSRYGRDGVLDELAHSFMDEDSEANHKTVMQRVLRIKAKHPAAFRYYKLMKMVLTGGLQALHEERDRITAEIAMLPKAGKEYAKLRGMQNVLTQFAKIEIKKGEVFVLDPDNFDYVCNGRRNVMVKFYAPWCGHCQHLAPIYKEVAEAVQDDVVIAELDADKYQELASKFGIQGFPTLKWFGNGEDPNLPRDVDSARTKESLLGYIHVQIYGEEPESKPEESKEPKEPEDEVVEENEL